MRSSVLAHARAAWLVSSLAFTAITAFAGTSSAGEVQGYFGGGLSLGVPRGPAAAHLWAVTPGFDVAAGVGHRDIPVTIGLRAGIATSGASSQRGPTILYFDDDRSPLRDTTYDASSSIRHIELVLRVAPEWHVVRPFAEASFGVVALWNTLELKDEYHQVLASEETQTTAAPAYGFTLGVAFEPWSRSVHEGNGRPDTAGIAFTAGLRFQRTGSLDFTEPTADPSSQKLTFGTTSGPLTTWTPFIGVEIAVN